MALPEILIVDDNAEDAATILDLLKGTGLAHVAIHCDCGDKALARIADQSQALPAFVLLDVHMPGTGGLEVLQTLRASPRARLVPVIMVSGSAPPELVHACYAAGANSYLVKALSLGAWQEALQTVLTYWLRVAVLPEA